MANLILDSVTVTHPILSLDILLVLSSNKKAFSSSTKLFVENNSIVEQMYIYSPVHTE